jgi:hypothetical protein
MADEQAEQPACAVSTCSAPREPDSSFCSAHGPKDETGSKSGSPGCLIAIGVVLLGVLVLIVWGAIAGPDTDTGAILAEDACHDAVKAQLKSPSSASFPGGQVTERSGGYVVEGAVDSQNSFGAMIRNTFTCTVAGDNDSVRVVNVTGLEN